MRFIISLFFGFNFYLIAAQSSLATTDSLVQNRWVDSVYNSFSTKQKIGQLFMIQVFSEENNINRSKLINMIKDYQVGGIIFSKGGPVRQANLNNELQRVSKLPLMIAMDAEWGLNMRLDSTYAFPWNMTLGAITDLNLIQKKDLLSFL